MNNFITVKVIYTMGKEGRENCHVNAVAHNILLIFFVLTTQPVKENKSCCCTETKQIECFFYRTQR